MYRIVLQFYFDYFSVYRTLHERSKTHSSEGSLQSGKWTKPNPVMSTENRPVDISSVVLTMMQGGSQLKIIGGPALLRDWPPGGTL